MKTLKFKTDQVTKLCRLSLIAGEVSDSLKMANQREIRAKIRNARQLLHEAAVLIKG